MSAPMKLDAKKKYSQNDLRRMMMEQKSKTAKKTTTTKIDSPLANVFHLHQSSTYNELGQLLCILCKSVVRSEDVWKVHINAKQHKQNIELAKQLKEKASSFAVPSKPVPTKRSATQPLDPPQAPKVPKGILKNATKPVVSSTAQSSTNEIGENGLPANFFDNAVDKPKNFFEATLKKTSIKADLVNIKRSEADNNADAIVESMETDQPAKDDVLPEGFFDDPVKDAKARNSDYKDPVEEEWEKFQQEIKEASNFSNAIIAEDQEEATTERQIDEIDEQIRNWTRVLELEKKKEDVNTKMRKDDKSALNTTTKRSKTKSSAGVGSQNADDSDEGGSGDSDIGDIDEYLDWRAKKAYK